MVGLLYGLYGLRMMLDAPKGFIGTIHDNGAKLTENWPQQFDNVGAFMEVVKTFGEPKADKVKLHQENPANEETAFFEILLSMVESVVRDGVYQFYIPEERSGMKRAVVDERVDVVAAVKRY